MKSNSAYLRPTVWLAIVTLVILAIVARSFAATYTMFEGESGARSGQAQVGSSDASASGNGYLAFTTPSSEQTGVWQDVTPSNMPLSGGTCDSYGLISMEIDPKRPSDIYTMADCAGIWKSTDYGKTWNGPLNTGTNGAASKNCAGGIGLGAGTGTNPPIIYQDCIRGNVAFWRSTDGGVNWTSHDMSAAAGRIDYYPPAVDPYDSQHVLVGGHEFSGVLESTDGGDTWRNVPLNSGMQNGGSGYMYFVDTGNAATTRTTWIFSPQITGSNAGTWRTTNSGSSWTRVNGVGRGHGSSRAYQIKGTGTIFIPAQDGDAGGGVYRSTDYGVTWTHVGSNRAAAVVLGTSNRIYSGYSWACGGCNVEANLQSAPAPGATGWTDMAQPSGMAIGPAAGTTTFDGSHNIVLTGNWREGIWRYVEP